MANEHATLELTQYRSLVEEWPRWSERLGARGMEVGQFNPRMRPWALAAQDRDTWTLALVIAAYAQFAPPLLFEGKADEDLSLVTHLLIRPPEEFDFRDLERFAEEVARRPLQSLIGSAQHLHHIFEEHRPVAARSMGCLAFCLNQYPEDREGFLRCIEEC